MRPFLGVFVSIIRVALGHDAHLLKFLERVVGYDVDAKAALADLVDGRNQLGGDGGMVERRVDGREQLYALGDRGDRTGLCERLDG